MSKTSRQAIAPSANTPIDFKVDPKTGVGYISQRKAAELCGVPARTLMRLINAAPDNANFTNENRQLSESGFELCVTYALGLGKPEAAKLASKLIKAGIRAFIYSQAHYNPLHPNADLAVHTDLMFKINIPERWVVEVIQRSQSSVRRSLSTAIKRSIGSALEKHYLWRDGERWYSAWFLANAPFAKEDGTV